ncbi:alpha-N-acetylgalactosaminide alpha-2,6-sialyltransferase 1-like [Triplophysa rosa]|uniref:alpha-N-acetylgalactosaminide alpha-2,6-sialyltransferase 1-like n=1 Tax=Triplophysa rosa TaxID=992332 RepID=UPI002545F184|nr:alpha-N-acetylgalactosaminide alpha-2,6-sialyltransferase 1-like [Triplophysa rosa]
MSLSSSGTTSLYKAENLSAKREDNTTSIPILYKKNFTKLPRWDFEDVDLQDPEARKPTCSKSLRNTEDLKFKEAFLPDIQLWLYRGQLNTTEWNRLAHFNNPFGFMEYRYDDIKPAADLIPKPKSSILLPVPERAKDGCIRCAVLGSGGILNNSGKVIDSHDYVFRVSKMMPEGLPVAPGPSTGKRGLRFQLKNDGPHNHQSLWVNLANPFPLKELSGLCRNARDHTNPHLLEVD